MRSVLFEYPMRYASIEPLLGQFATQTGFAMTQSWHTHTDTAVYLGHWQEAHATRLNREAVHRQVPLLLFMPLEASFVGTCVMPYQSPCLACLAVQQTIFGALAQFTPTLSLSQPHADAMFRVFHAMLTHANDHLRPGVMTEFAVTDASVMRQYRVVKSPRCTVCSPLLTHSAESYRSYLS